MTCPIDGYAIISNEAGERRWKHADPQIHVAADLFDEASRFRLKADALAFFAATYELGDNCPHRRGAVHAHKRG